MPDQTHFNFFLFRRLFFFSFFSFSLFVVNIKQIVLEIVVNCDVYMKTNKNRLKLETRSVLSVCLPQSDKIKSFSLSGHGEVEGRAIQL